MQKWKKVSHMCYIVAFIYALIMITVFRKTKDTHKHIYIKLRTLLPSIAYNFNIILSYSYPLLKKNKSENKTKIICSSAKDETWLGKLKLKKSSAVSDAASKGTQGPFVQLKDNFNAPPEEVHALKRARGSSRPLR